MAEIPNFLPPNLQGLAVSPPGTADADRKKLGQDEFFQLMVAQLQNQDPLKPLESNEFLSQVAQFSMVSGIEDMQASISHIAGAMQSNQALQASLLVGRDVLVPGNVATFTPGESLNGSVELSASSPQVNMQVFDSAGQLVREIALGVHERGQVRFSWDGVTDAGKSAAPGVYTLRASALVDGKVEAMSTLVETRVESVTLNSNPPGLTLNLKNLGPFNLNDVRELL